MESKLKVCIRDQNINMVKEHDLLESLKSELKDNIYGLSDNLRYKK